MAWALGALLPRGSQGLAVSCRRVGGLRAEPLRGVGGVGREECLELGRLGALVGFGAPTGEGAATLGVQCTLVHRFRSVPVSPLARHSGATEGNSTS
ncbi:uncharacterized protein STAUR_1410 [Stigmatella aurantiaca DW4/3-1]|uniref:Uncharacterized protein n=1 Tax=Stigmatella aurantiaca (strain DW4/3-1) TaxID=378806 RepID=E3FKP6_STIAD|nr:uncharacterized protein STAUR_1410 [Stigmatella aurantiaca DW4/3-1]